MYISTALVPEDVQIAFDNTNELAVVELIVDDELVFSLSQLDDEDFNSFWTRAKNIIRSAMLTYMDSSFQYVKEYSADE